MQIFVLRHVLIYPNGHIVIARHNEIYDEIIHPAKQAFSLVWIYIKYLIHLGRSRSEE